VILATILAVRRKRTMSERYIDVFFYGLFMDAELLQSKGVDAANIRRARLPGYELRIGARATLVQKPGACAYGILVGLTHAQIAQLYSESSVAAYRPEPVQAELADGSSVAALCFNLVEPPPATDRNPEYAAKLRALAEKLQLPADYIAGIR
jgi:gamma-glutamyl AIG2-like cyclotransferase